MISADTNLFIYAYDSGSPRYGAAQAFFQRQAGNRDFFICGLMLIELYMQLRNPSVVPKPLSPADAVDYCEYLAGHVTWRYVDYDRKYMSTVWKQARLPSFAFRRIIDARLAVTLIQNGVTDFATANVKDFQDFGFRRVWNPLEEAA